MSVALADGALFWRMKVLDDVQVLGKHVVVQVVDRSRTDNSFGANFGHLDIVCTFLKCRSVCYTDPHSGRTNKETNIVLAALKETGKYTFHRLDNSRSSVFDNNAEYSGIHQRFSPHGSHNCSTS